MIIDSISNLLMYETILPGLSKGLEAVNKQAVLTEGKYFFEGGFFLVQKGETKPMAEGTFEAHRKYADVQMVMAGSEEVAWADIRDLQTVIPYDEEKDAERLDGDKSHSMLISQGMFYIALPHDGHKPVSHTVNKQSFTKVVIKLPV